jgi:putative ABC transport system substrate-binding protein
MSYAPDDVEMFRRAASYVDRILRGSKPGDLPAELPTKFVLAINVWAARALGVNIPQSLRVQADQVIE